MKIMANLYTTTPRECIASDYPQISLPFSLQKVPSKLRPQSLKSLRSLARIINEIRIGEVQLIQALDS